MTGWDLLLEHAARKMSPPYFISLTLPYPPSANEYWGLAHGRIVVTETARKYKAQVGRICRDMGLLPLKGDVHFELMVYRPQQSGDLSNRIKVLEDALQGWTYLNDSQVAGIRARRIDGKEPCVAVRVIGFQGHYTAEEMEELKPTRLKRRRVKKQLIGRAIPALTKPRRP